MDIVKRSSYPRHRKPQSFVGKLLIALWILPIPSMVLIASQLNKQRKPGENPVCSNERGHYRAS